MLEVRGSLFDETGVRVYMVCGFHKGKRLTVYITFSWRTENFTSRKIINTDISFLIRHLSHPHEFFDPFLVGFPVQISCLRL